MNNQLRTRLARFRPKPLTVCLSVAFVAGSMMTAPAFAFTTWPVTNCQDNGDVGSLRVVAANPAVQSGDTIDLSGLPLACGTRDSVITLEHGSIPAHDKVMFLGPSPESGSVTIVAEPGNRNITHTSGGILTIAYLTLANGHNGYRGGCIDSAGQVNIDHSVVTGCSLSGGGALDFLGGAIYAATDVDLVHSTVSGSAITKASDAFFARGGGVFAKGQIIVAFSSVRDNHVVASVAARGQGGGIYTPTGFVNLNNSAIENNSATGMGGGISVSQSVGTNSISNSTISGNTALRGGGINLTGYGKMKVSNSTIAFNRATYSQTGIGGLAGCYGCTLTLQSSIVANNTDGELNAASDLYADPAKLQGADNLVMSSNMFAPPAGVIRLASDPKLGPLQFNGGPTRSHALLAGSPVLGIGNNLGGFPNDQRGPGYPRITGSSVNVDIGAYEYDSIFAASLEPF
jgi:hypothetical protein